MKIKKCFFAPRFLMTEPERPTAPISVEKEHIRSAHITLDRIRTAYIIADVHIVHISQDGLMTRTDLTPYQQMEQRELILAVKSRLALSRDGLATMISASRRQLDTWVLPADSSGRRTMDRNCRRQLEALMARCVREEALIVQGRLKRQSAQEVSFRSPVSGIAYPAIYQISVPKIAWDGDEFHHESISNVRLAGGVDIAYDFSPEYRGMAEALGFAPGQDIRFESVSRLPVEAGWITLYKLTDEREYDGHIAADLMNPLLLRDDRQPSTLIKTPHGLFACRHHLPDEFPAYNGLIICKGWYEQENPVLPFLPDDCETHVLLPDGRIKGEGYLFRLAGHPYYQDEEEQD